MAQIIVWGRLRKPLKKLQRLRNITYFCLRKYCDTNVFLTSTFATGILLPGDQFKIQSSLQNLWRFFKRSYCLRSRSNCFLNCQATKARFKQALVLFWPPDIINFLLKYLSIITSVQSKQMYSFDELETHTRSIVLVRVELNLTASHVSLRIVWQFGPHGISRGTLIGWSAATRFWVAKIAGNQVGKVLCPAGTE